jgi:predicted ester cyclase
MKEAIMDRVTLVRQMFEGKSDPGLFSPKYVSHAPWDQVVQHAAKQRGESEKPMFHAEKVFADTKVHLEEVFEEGEKVVARWRFQGKWTQPIPGIKIKPTGRHIDVTGVNVYHFDGNKIVQKFGQFNVGAFHADACTDRVDPAECVEALAVLGVRA